MFHGISELEAIEFRILLHIPTVCSNLRHRSVVKAMKDHSRCCTVYTLLVHIAGTCSYYRDLFILQALVHITGTCSYYRDLFILQALVHITGTCSYYRHLCTLPCCHFTFFTQFRSTTIFRYRVAMTVAPWIVSQQFFKFQHVLLPVNATIHLACPFDHVTICLNCHSF
jgi:hypothetical protein